MIRYPAEWEQHASVWLAWPAHQELWQESLKSAQSEFVRLCRGIQAAPGSETICLLVRNPKDKIEAERALSGLDVQYHLINYGDIWLRDTAPIFVEELTTLVGHAFQFNGWGEKYLLPHDHEVARNIMEYKGYLGKKFEWVLEGGAVEPNGKGALLTTEQCLLNPNRNPQFNRVQIESALRESLGAEQVLWIKEGMLNDHTDGHIDTLVRFVSEDTVVCMEPNGNDDPNREVFEQIIRELKAMRVGSNTLNIETVPSPGLITDEDEVIMPASHVNFYIANHSVVVPLYQTHVDDKVVQRFEALFPGRTIIGTSAKTILEGGGAFHCITQQVPLIASAV